MDVVPVRPLVQVPEVLVSSPSYDVAPATVAQSTVADVLVIAVDERKPGVPQLDPAVMVKFVFEISKKILPTASTLDTCSCAGSIGYSNHFRSVIGCAGN